jgi:enoyl-CoA hydratase
MADQFYRTLRYEEKGHCRAISLFSETDDEAAAFQISELSEICDRITYDETARVVVIVFDGTVCERTSTPAVWGAGLERSSLVEPVARLKKPVIAAIAGDATGLGLELALACDIRIGTEDGRFGFPQIKEGRIPSHGGTQRMPRLIGHARALQMILTGELIDAVEAKQAGLLNRTVSSAALIGTAMEMARDMAEKSPLSLGYAKEALYKSRDLTLDQGLSMELDLYLLLFNTSDRTEGITAFKEKRKPEFEGA